MVMSDFRLEVEIQLFCACAMKNMQYNPYLWLNRLNFRILKETGVEEHVGDVRFKSGSGNMAVSCMHNAYDPNNRNIIIGTVWSLWTWLWGRYHVPQNIFLVPTITNRVNMFLSSGQFHPILKESTISSLLKKCTLDEDQLFSSYTDISSITVFIENSYNEISLV